MLLDHGLYHIENVFNGHVILFINLFSSWSVFFTPIIRIFIPIMMEMHKLLPQTDAQRWQKEDFCDIVHPAEPRYGQTLVCR